MKNIKIYIKEIFKNWKENLQSKSFLIETLLTAILLTLLVNFGSGVIDLVEKRHGVLLYDPLLSLFKPVNLNLLLFIIINFSGVIAVILLLKYPKDLVYAVQAYGLMLIFRVVSMYLTPLEPPQLMIPLQDPFLKLLSADGSPWTRDLFFSGHTASIVILYLTAKNKYFKIIMLIGIYVVSACLILQHVHYTIDVLAAPFFAYGSYRIVKLVHNRIGER